MANTMNTRSVSITQAIKLMTGLYKAAIQQNISLKELPSVMLWGAPGVGKSQGIRQMADALRKETGKKVSVIDVRLLLFNPVDLRGIPTANADRTLAVWLRPKIFDLNPGKDHINILFLDEITACPPSVQAAAYQLTLDRKVGEHALPDNTIVICAGNRTTDRSVAYNMPRALANRLCHLEIVSDSDRWLDWAVKQSLHPFIVGFISFRREQLMRFATDNDDLAFATPRSWEMVNSILKLNSNVAEVFDLIAGCIGQGAALEFLTYTRVFASLPDISMIFAGRSPGAPSSSDALYALISSMTKYSDELLHDNRKMGDDGCAEQRISNAAEYANRKLPPEFAVLFLKNLLALDMEEDKRFKVLNSSGVKALIRSKGGVLNG